MVKTLIRIKDGKVKGHNEFDNEESFKNHVNKLISKARVVIIIEE